MTVPSCRVIGSANPHGFPTIQDVSGYWHIRERSYLWKSDAEGLLGSDWLDEGHYIGKEAPEILSHSINATGFCREVEASFASVFVSIPWLGAKHVG